MDMSEYKTQKKYWNGTKRKRSHATTDMKTQKMRLKNMIGSQIYNLKMGGREKWTKINEINNKEKWGVRQNVR